jgi:hypothetical protein
VGTGGTSISETFDASNSSNKAQYLWTATELSAAGLTAGNIDKLKFDVTALGGNLNNLEVKMKHSSLTSLSETSYEEGGFTDVYLLNTEFSSIGTNSINLTTPFNWDGTSNIVIDFSFTNSSAGTGYELDGSTTANNMGLFSTQDDRYLDFTNADYVDVPASSFANVDDEITIAFWQFGNAPNQPRNNYTLSGVDANGRRVLNVHLPWGNGRVYWDAGNSGTNSYDRIDQASTPSDFEGQWNHWAFTKNASNGEMKIYLNGALFHSGNGLTRSMDGITAFRIAGLPNSSTPRGYEGAINNFEIWNKALDQTEIQSWLYKDIESSHPDYANLQAYYKFDELNGIDALDASGNGNTGVLVGLPTRKNMDGFDHFRNLEATNKRPDITFTQGTYNSEIDSVLVTDSTLRTQVSIVESTTSIDMNQAGINEDPTDTTYAWLEGWSFTYNDNGDKIDSSFNGFSTELINTYSQNVFEIQNYVTPYGIGLDLGPNGFRWVYDVTDYQRLLSDTVEISAGNQQELIDLKFIMIKGTPPRDVLGIEQIWRGRFQHSNIANDISLPAVDINLNPAATSYRIKTRTSGHFFGGFQNCAEFCPKLHHLNIDGVMRFQWSNWTTECAENPVIDQGGTWIYDRAGWCPGAFTDTYDHELTPFVTPGNTISLDYGMEVTPGGMEGNYLTSVQLVSYGDYNHNLDARVYEIISPNDWEFRERVNPICKDPKIVIQNTGSTTLTSLTITYNVKGGSPEIYSWTGSLDFMEKEEVVLPIGNQSFWNTSSNENIFEVNVSAPNGSTDEYIHNNNASSSFEKPDVYTGKFFIQLQTNNAPQENSYTIKDDQGNIVASRNNMSASTLYRDTIDLPNGCYVFEFLDSDQDGLSFFANNDGNGQLRMRSIPSSWMKIFNTNFGSFIKHHFVIDDEASVDAYQKFHDVQVSPNPSSGIVIVNISGFENEKVNVGIYNTMGQVITTKALISSQNMIETSFDLSELSNGVYYVRVFGQNDYTVKKIIKR